MRQAPPDLRDRARALLAREAGDSPPPDTIASAAAGALLKLHDHLARIIGTAGFDALLVRALRVACREYPCLDGVQARPGGVLEAYGEPAPGRAPRDCEAGFVLVMANVLWLLVTFIGEDLVSRLVGEVWPAAAPDGGAPASDVEEGE